MQWIHLRFSGIPQVLTIFTIQTVKMFIWLIVDGYYEVTELKFFIPCVVQHNKTVCLPRLYIQQWKNLPPKHLFYILITKYLFFLLIFEFQKSKNNEGKPAKQTQVKITLLQYSPKLSVARTKHLLTSFVTNAYDYFNIYRYNHTYLPICF